MSDTTNLTQGPGWGNLNNPRFGNPQAAVWAQPGAGPPVAQPGANPLLGAGPGGPPPVTAQAPPRGVLPVGLPRAQVPANPAMPANPLTPPQVMPTGPTVAAPNPVAVPGVPGGPEGTVTNGPGTMSPPQLQSRPGMSPGDWQAHVASLYPVGGAFAP